MVGLIERRISKSAIWCRRIAVFAIPYFLLIILLHRLGKISTSLVMGAIGFGVIMLLVAVVLALYAITRLWVEGAKGGKSMALGLFISIIMLIPFFYYGALAMVFPPLNDIATNSVSQPEFGEKIVNARARENTLPQSDVSEPFTLGEVESIALAYPKIGPRRYPAGAERVYRAARELVLDRGWRILQIRGVNDEPTENSAKKPKEQNAPEGVLDGGVLPDIFIDALSKTLIFAFRNDVVIKIISEDENTLVQMRSASRWGSHDFGQNAKIIEQFLHDLDQSLIGIAGEG